MKRILIFSLNYYPFVGGAEVAIKEITDRIAPSDIEFHLIALRLDSHLPRVEKMGHVLVHRVGFTRPSPTMSDLKKFPLHLNKYLLQILAWRKAEELHKKYHYDATWAMMAHSCGIPAALFKMSHPSVPYLLTLQEGDPPAYIEKTMKPAWPLFVRAFTKADYLQPISLFLRAWGMQMGFRGETYVIPNGVDIEKFSHVFSGEAMQQKKQELGKKEDDVYLVTTSRLVRKNGLDLVIRALPLLPKHISFLIYGIGPEEEKLKSLAKECGVEDRVRFMGQISHDDMPLMLTACDIFTRPSRSEGMGNSFVEAMAAGLPVIATQEGGIADFLYDAKRNPEKPTTGWAVDIDAPQQIAHAVEDILAHPDTVAPVRETAKTMVTKTYNWKDIAVSMQGLFERMLKAG